MVLNFIKTLFPRAPEPSSGLLEGFYGQIVAASRAPVFYTSVGVPDTPLGRFEMLSLHMALVLRRLRRDFSADYRGDRTGVPATQAEEWAQDLTDRFFLDLDHAQRTLGVGDLGMKRRMKTMGKMYFGRLKSYGSALDRRDLSELTEALRRNIGPADRNFPGAEPLANYVLAADTRLADRAIDDLRDHFAELLEAPRALLEDGSPEPWEGR